ncbi:MAG: group II intron maturase-specific domain-containing protein, partial [Crocosphaera sp.]
DCPKVARKLIKQWLRAGVLDKGNFEETHKGTPQGGVISPLLANIALHGLISDIQKSFPGSITINGKRQRGYQPKIIRYADDFVVVHNELEVIQQCKKLITNWLMKMGLELKPEKTRICHTMDSLEIDGDITEPGFDFLGFNVRQHRVSKHNSGKNGNKELLGFKTIITPSKKAIKAHYQKLRETIDRNRKVPQSELIRKLNPIISGWCNYYRTVVSKEVFSKMDDRIWSKLRAWTVSRATKKNKKNDLLSTYFSPGEHGVWTFQTKTGIAINKHAKVDIIRHTLIKGDVSPYNGDWVYWSKRRGQYTDTPKRVSLLLKKQNGKCNLCGQHFTSEDLVEVDHIIPTNKGGKDEYKNLQLLHRHCHDVKSRQDNSHNIDTSEYTWEEDVLTVPMTTAN